jgi:hypothetical protein
MTDKPDWEQIQRDRDERVALPLDEDEALRGLLAVEPERQSSGPEKTTEPARDE